MLNEMEPRAPAGQPGAPDNPYLAIRTRFFDDELLEAARTGIRQIAILAAGMDTRAFRLDWPADTTVFEVERPDVLAYKEAVLASCAPTTRARRAVVAADLRAAWRAALTAAGFNQERPAAFLVEGLLPYVNGEEDAVALLSSIAAIAAPGSVIALDVVGQTFLTSRYTQSYLALLAARGVPWYFGTEEPEALLERSGFSEARVVQPGEEGYGRHPYPVAPRGVPGYPRTYMVVARRR